MITNGLGMKRENAGTKKSPQQIQMLEKFYSEVQFPKPKDMAEYATSVGLTYSQVRIWFKERRRKERREMETIGLHMERQLSNQAPMYDILCSRPEFDSRSMSIIGEECTVQSQVLFPKDYILRKIFCKDGPPLGSKFDPLPDSAHGHSRDATCSCSSQNQRAAKKRKIVESTNQKSTVPYEDTVLVRKHGIGKGLMSVWHAMYSHNVDCQRGSNFIDETGCLRSLRPFDDCDGLEDHANGKRTQNQGMTWKKVDKKSKPPLNKRKVPFKRVTGPKEHPPMDCHLSVDKSESSELQPEQVTLVDDEELELSELQAGPNPLRCSAHLSSSGRHGCPLCKDLLAKFPPQSVKMKQPFSAKPWDSSPEMVKKLFQVVRFVYTHFGSIDVHPFTFDEFAQAFHDKDSLLLGEVHAGLLKLLLLKAEMGSGGVFVPRSSKDCRFLSFLNFVRKQEFDVNFWIKSLNSLTWVEILRQVLVASGFGSKQHMLNQDFLNKEKNQMVKYGLRPRTLKGELFALLSKEGSGGLKVSELAKSSEIVDLNVSGTSELEQLICLTLSSDITLFEKIAPSAYRLRVDPRIKGKEDTRSDSEDSGSVDDEGASSSDDESHGLHKMSSPEHESRIARRKKQKIVHGSPNKCSEIDESYSGEPWLLGLMEGEYSDLSIDEKLDCLVDLIDVYGVGSVPRLEEPQRVLHNAPIARPHPSGGKIKKSTKNFYQSSDESLNGPGNSYSLGSSQQCLSGRRRSQDYIVDSGRNDLSGVAHEPQVVLLGSDRRYNSYWLFLGPCRADDPGHRRVYFESSEDGHWEVVDSPQELLSLLSVLDSRGTREAHLLASMDKRQVCLFEAMKKHLEGGNAIGLLASSDSYRSKTSSGDGTSPKTNSVDRASPVSDIENASVPRDLANSNLDSSSAIVIEIGRGDEKILMWERLQALDKWIWTSFYSALTAVKCGKKSFKESLVRCESCHDLYWRDEKHCRICHSTFEVGFDLEERYAVHVATCRESEDVHEVPNHKVLPSQLQALKAAIHAIEASMPEAAFAGSWMKSAHKLWVKRLRRTSSLPELLQVLVDFVGAMDEDWLYKSSSVSFSSYQDDIIVYFQTMPQTTSAVALWVVKLDALIAPYLGKADSARTLAIKEPSRTRSQACAT
ncbi:homeobox-DDT domain protein RLT3-like isoform X2 [Phragmites australis]|nr:homeobox-DDT domain protein RLT3-like isoform X2 [Phragmites australis]XP_062231137.1 homeobox-DDT domain protein RLT3-like isoform X2 [Phragmites australis]